MYEHNDTTHVPAVSIIVPVYNAGMLLRACVDSILDQYYGDFELLLIDDGSTDGSGDVCDEYAKRDSRVISVHKSNGGVSDTRNVGIRRASGRYLQFVDSDDRLAPDATGSMVQAMEENGCDMVIADFYRVVGNHVSQKGDIDDEVVLSREEFASRMMENPADFYYGVLWNKMFRRDIVAEHGLTMNTDISWCEDFMFNLEYIRYVKSVYPLHVPIYYYYKRKGSLVSTQSFSVTGTVKMKLTVFERYNEFFRTVMSEDEYEKRRMAVYRFLIDAAGDGGALPLPGTKKLGDERLSAAAHVQPGDGVLSDAFRQRRAFEGYLETAALKNSLTLNDAYVLMSIGEGARFANRKALAEFVRIPPNDVNTSLKRLSSRDLISWKYIRGADGKRELVFTFKEAAKGIIGELSAAQKAYLESGISSSKAYVDEAALCDT